MERFLLTRPLRDVTGKAYQYAKWCAISTHTPLAGRDFYELGISGRKAISTHTPLAGRDGCLALCNCSLLVISTHTPLAGRDSVELYGATG